MACSLSLTPLWPRVREAYARAAPAGSVAERPPPARERPGGAGEAARRGVVLGTRTRARPFRVSFPLGNSLSLKGAGGGRGREGQPLTVPATGPLRLRQPAILSPWQRNHRGGVSVRRA